MLFIPPPDYSFIQSLRTGVQFWVPTSALPHLTGSARNQTPCPVHGPHIHDDASVIDVLAERILRHGRHAH